jgi:hypothetical protein
MKILDAKLTRTDDAADVCTAAIVFSADAPVKELEFAAGLRAVPTQLVGGGAFGKVLYELSIDLPIDMFNSNTVDFSWSDGRKGGTITLLNIPTKSDDDRELVPANRDGIFAKGLGQVAAAVNDTTASVDDITTYPSLNMSLPLSVSGSTSTPGSGLQQQAMLAVQQVLGWKPRENDAKGFVGSLTQSFDVKQVDGHVVSTWTPRTYTVQTDLAGSITGAQASIYQRAVKAVKEAKDLLLGLKPIRVVADPEDRTAVQSLIANRLDELVAELGTLSGPRVPRVDGIFKDLVGGDPAINIYPNDNPDTVTGMLGDLRDEFGLYSTVPIGLRADRHLQNENLVNTVEEEQVVTNFRIVVDYIIGIANSWIRDRKSFLPGATQGFLGTQLVRINRLLATIVESVGELRLRYDSVLLGASERSTLRISDDLQLEELLDWIQNYAAEEVPRQLREGGKYGATRAVDVLEDILDRAKGAVTKARKQLLPPAHSSNRVQNGWKDIIVQLKNLDDALKALDHEIPSLSLS